MVVPGPSDQERLRLASEHLDAAAALWGLGERELALAEARQAANLIRSLVGGPL